ncbi:MAG: Lauroyl-KDO2-lipid IV(A) myristoyltransferase [uncultured Thiotrichaceae bacterium]|uniref:Lauroyl-KDO2-lipid IV(A) myristoyltransferase n=1 Tax=uncultured Thiotrichaceae bacterium TaxID=298394 RepID=A0A6S6TN64_9GAMM|nr:MAG: Lauroyl-KDO2-lipid IV(A) myristoyltransferase [uncultured Thiotrichaceae bacterium]
MCNPPFARRFLKPKYWLTWLGLFFMLLLSVMPLAIRQWVGGIIGRLLLHSNDKRRNIAKKNLSIVFPDDNEQQINERVAESFYWQGVGLAEYSLLFFASKRRLCKYIKLDGVDKLEEANRQKQNAVLLLLHSSMLDLAPFALGDRYTVYGSYKPVKNGLLDWFVRRARCRSVAFVVAREEGMMKLVKSLVPGRFLIFLPDEDLGEKHADFVDFFGVPKATLNTPARIAKMKSAKCFPCFAFFDKKDRQYHIKVSPEIQDFPAIDSQESASKLNSALEVAISEAPEQYMWSLQYFKTRPKNTDSVY